MCGNRTRERTGMIDNDLVFLGLGSNLEDRRSQIEKALLLLNKAGVRITRSSSLYETEPVGIADQPWFLNMVIAAQTHLSPRDLLHLSKRIERQAGRTYAVRFGPRQIDIDILLYKEQTYRDADIEIPHPRMHERRFVLVPLLEIAPDITIPGTNRKYASMLAGLNETKQVAKSKEQGF